MIENNRIEIYICMCLLRKVSNVRNLHTKKSQNRERKKKKKKQQQNETGKVEFYTMSVNHALNGNVIWFLLVVYARVGFPVNAQTPHIS